MNSLYSHSHNMDNTKENLTFLLTSEYAEKSLFNVLGFNVTLVWKYVMEDQQYILWIIVKASATVSDSFLLMKKWASTF